MWLNILLIVMVRYMDCSLLVAETDGNHRSTIPQKPTVVCQEKTH
jgi:hypothetical protein